MRWLLLCGSHDGTLPLWIVYWLVFQVRIFETRTRIQTRTRSLPITRLLGRILPSASTIVDFCTVRSLRFSYTAQRIQKVNRWQSLVGKSPVGCNGKEEEQALSKFKIIIGRSWLLPYWSTDPNIQTNEQILVRNWVCQMYNIQYVRMESWPILITATDQWSATCCTLRTGVFVWNQMGANLSCSESWALFCSLEYAIRM